MKMKRTALLIIVLSLIAAFGTMSVNAQTSVQTPSETKAAATTKPVAKPSAATKTPVKPVPKPVTKPAVPPVTKPVIKSTRLFPFSTDGKFTYVDVNGKAVLKTDYGFADDFIGGYAHIMNEFGGMSGYIDLKGNQLPSFDSGVDTSKANLEYRGAREIKGDTVVDLSKKVKKYTSTHDGWKAQNEDYSVGDGFEVRIWTASGAPNTSLYKNGKIMSDKLKQLQGNDIFAIVKYDNEKIIRFLYADASTGLFKTLYIDYNGNPIWVKK